MLELMKKAGMIEVKPKRKIIIEVINSPGCLYGLEQKYDSVITRELIVPTPEDRDISGTPMILINNKNSLECQTL